MSQRSVGVREANRLWIRFHAIILQKSRMRRRARTDLCGGRLVRVVPTATSTHFWCNSGLVMIVGQARTLTCLKKRFRLRFGSRIEMAGN